MTRIFLTLTVIGNLLLAGTFLLGMNIDDAGSLTETARHQVTWHFLTALGSAMLAMAVHAIALTYFMGTGRWIEETTAAYKLGETARKANIRLKYRVLPGMIGCILLIIVTGAFGAIADPASNSQMPSAPLIHFSLAVATLLANLFVSTLEWSAIEQNGKLVDGIVVEVRRIRAEHGLAN
jgi:hypothetical protein